jgi:Leucine-rich repeat (LRR) protein
LNGLGTADGFEFTAPVDSYGERGRNGFGLADMLGNVYEWCLDDYDSKQAHEECYKGNPGARVLRGGAFYNCLAGCRCAHRPGDYPAYSYSNYGFRVCVGVDVSSARTSTASTPLAAATAVSNAPPVISNWQDVMPTVRAEMDKSLAARHEDGWVVVVQDPRNPIYICNQPLGDVAVRGRFRSECSVHLAVSGIPSTCYAADLKRGNGAFVLRRYVGTRDNNTLETQNIGSLRYPAADEHDFLIAKVGDLLRAWVDGTFVGSARDATVASGKARIYLSHPGQAIRDLAIADLSAAAPATADAGWQDAINLLPLIDPQKDAVDGTWTIQNGELCVASNKYARLQIPYQAPAEYDFRISFTRQSGRDSIWQILTGGGRQFDWNLAGGPGKCFGFEKIKEELAHLSPYSVPMDRNLENGRRYTSEVQVRRSGLKAFLDGRFITEWKTDYRDMSLPSMLVLPSARCLGIGTHQSPAIFHRIEVREVTGKGTFTRGAPTSASTTPTLPPSTVAAPWLSAFCAEVAALPREEQVKRVAAKLKELNPQFDGRVTGKDLDKSTWAAISLSASGVSDVSPLRALTWLKWLTCSCTPPARSELSDLSSLSSLKLLTVNFSGTQVRDLSPLRDMPLQTVYLNFCPVTDLSPLENCPLEHIGLSGTPLRDLKLLRRFRLTNLNIRSVPANDLSPLSGMPLTTLNLARVKIRDIALLAGMPLTWLDCTGTGVSDLAPLRGAPLQTLNCEPAVIAQPANAKVIRAITTLQKINDLPAAEFWKQVDAGKLPQPAGKADEPTQDRSSAIDDAFLREVAALPAEQQVACVVAKLKELNPGFDPAVAEVKHTIENGKVATLFFRAFGVTNISPLRALSGLERLNCIGVPGKYSPLAELSPLRGMALKDVNFYGTDVCDLSPLKGMPLYRITCSHTQVADLSPLEGMQLKILQCYETKIRDLSPLRGMPLFSLYCHQTAVSDLSPLANMPLKELRFEQALMRSLPNRDVVRNLTTLEKINESPAAEFWKKVDAGTVPGATSTVDEAFIKQVAALPAEQQVVRVVDELKKRNPGYDGMKRHKIQDGQVIELELWTEHISDISPVRALPSLQNFYCTGPTDQNSQPTGKKGILADLSPLRGMHLTRFKCRYNQLSNLSPLAGHSLIYMECEAHPQVTDLSPLKGMPLTNLLIIGCGVSDLSPLKGLPLKQLRFDEALLSKGQNREILRSIKTLEKINNKPAVEFWRKADGG